MTTPKSCLEYGVRYATFPPGIGRAAVVVMLIAGAAFGAWQMDNMRPTVEPPRVEGLLDSMLVLGNPGPGLTSFVEDSLNTPDERSHAATLLAAFYNRREDPARALLALFYISRELDTEWTPEQALIAAESYSRLGLHDWAQGTLERIPYTHSMTELVRILHVYAALETLQDKDSLLEIRSRFERGLERSSDPMALMLALHGLGLCYIARGTAAAYDTAMAYLRVAVEDTAAAYLSFALQEYRDYSNDLPLAKRLIPYSLYWSGRASVHRGDGWTALQSFEEIMYDYPNAMFWEEAVVQYGALQLKRSLTDSVRFAANLLFENAGSLHKVLEARLLLATAAAYDFHYDSAAVAFASLSRALRIGDTMRVLSHAGMAASLLRYSESITDLDRVPATLQALDLSGYKPNGHSGDKRETGRALPYAKKRCGRGQLFCPRPALLSQPGNRGPLTPWPGLYCACPWRLLRIHRPLRTGA